MLQHDHTSTPFSRKENNLVVLCDGLQGPSNIGAIFRLCDAFGVREVIFNNAIDLSSNRLKRTARNTEKTTKHSIVEDLQQVLRDFQQQDYIVIAVEISENSVPISTISEITKNNTALVIGSERNGISETILQRANMVAHIEMYGNNSSMNVAQATAIALYELTKH
ncbi:TrmH family RNA methyltransferase [Marinirhabdus gelatinilytica]|uniref:SpoU rRNA methylase family protein n=1 Tax=Marinirhabdus gelatinilytica TaxID=1703343 RepID=A0A370QA87_9FLAO|nr:TrmH family RNA methyltransferase [Marinirhabdus gelatinilytica]RDK85286.1 SpoU rRNA methylase family protein [Marinirhabdus gelatinilytica]